MDEKVTIKSICIFILIALVYGYACYMFGVSSIHSDGREAEQFRQEIGNLTERNRTLQSDNDKLRNLNTKITDELRESRSISNSISDNNRETETRLTEAGTIVQDIRNDVREIRKSPLSEREKSKER